MRRINKFTIPYRDFTGGMHDDGNVGNLRPNEVLLMQNANPLPQGGYEQRFGCIKTNTLAGPIKRLINYKGINYATWGTKLVKWDGTVVTSGLASAEISWAIFKDILYILDGTNYYQYDGTTFDVVVGKGSMDISHIKRCKYLYKRGARLFFAGDPLNKNLMWFSAIGDATDLAFGSSVQAVTETNDTITGLFEFSKHMLVFQNRTLYGWSGWDPALDVQFDKLPVHRGTPSGRTIIDSEAMAIYYGLDGIYGLLSTLNYQINSDMLSEGMINTLKTITNPDKAVAINYQGKYLLAVCDNGTGINNMVIVGHTTQIKTLWPDKVTIPWTIYAGWQVNDWFIDPTTNYLMFASENNNIYQAFKGNSDDGVAIDCLVKHRIDLNKMFNKKQIKSMVIAFRQYVVESCVVNLNIKVDYKDSNFDINTDESMVYGEGFWGNTLWGWVDSVVKEIPLRVNGSFLELTLSHKVIDQPMTLYGFAFYVKIKNKPKGVSLGVSNNS